MRTPSFQRCSRCLQIGVEPTEGYVWGDHKDLADCVRALGEAVAALQDRGYSDD